MRAAFRKYYWNKQIVWSDSFRKFCFLNCTQISCDVCSALDTVTILSGFGESAEIKSGRGDRRLQLENHSIFLSVRMLISIRQKWLKNWIPLDDHSTEPTISCLYFYCLHFWGSPFLKSHLVYTVVNFLLMVIIMSSLIWSEMRSGSPTMNI